MSDNGDEVPPEEGVSILSRTDAYDVLDDGNGSSDGSGERSKPDVELEMSMAYVGDTQVGVLMDTEIDVEFSEIAHYLRQDPEVAQMMRWASTVSAPRRTRSSMFERDRYVIPPTFRAQMALAAVAAEEDDVVSGAIDMTEALAINRMSIQCAKDEDETDVWNQLAKRLRMDAMLRSMWRELFIYSQMYPAYYYGPLTLYVRGETESGNARRKSYQLPRAPLGITLLDPLKVVPTGTFLFGQETLLYIPSKSEGDQIREAMAGGDRVLVQIFGEEISDPEKELSEYERERITELGWSVRESMWRLRPENVYRHTLTRSHHERFSYVRFKSIFELLDLKHQLRASDRTTLISATNFIVIVRKGTDAHPAKNVEVQNLQRQFQTMARLPILIGDHRLSVEIVTPKTDQTLSPERYNALDSRITARLLGLMQTGNYSAGTRQDSSINLTRVIAQQLQTRRHMLSRFFEETLFDPTLAANDQLKAEPRLRFHPKRISVEFDPILAQYLLDIRDHGDLSRQSILEEVGYDEQDEAYRREIEAERFDDTFTPPAGNPWGGGQQPQGGTPQQSDPRTAGRNQGGLRSGGGGGRNTNTQRRSTPSQRREPRAREAAEGDADPDGEED